MYLDTSHYWEVLIKIKCAKHLFFSTSNKIGIPSDSCVYCQENNHGLHRIWYHIFVVEEIDAFWFDFKTYTVPPIAKCTTAWSLGLF